MTKIDLSKYTLYVTEGVFTLKNVNTTIGFVRFNDLGEVEYVFVNPMFRRQGLAKKLLSIVEEKTKIKPNPQDPISLLGEKLFKVSKFRILRFFIFIVMPSTGVFYNAIISAQQRIPYMSTSPMGIKRPSKASFNHSVMKTFCWIPESD